MELGAYCLIAFCATYRIYADYFVACDKSNKITNVFIYVTVMAASAGTGRLANVTECGICIANLTDARILPCFHTFCVKCIEKWSQNKQAGENVSCPMCREEFEIPEGGTAALPKNDFVEKLLNMKKLSTTLSQGYVSCEVGLCSDDKESSGEKTTKKATIYCTDCHQAMCEQCCRCHQKFRFFGVHKLVNMDELSREFSENLCDKHRDKCTEIYCLDCKEAMCLRCYIESHNSHKYSDIKEVAEDLGKQMSSNAAKLAEKVTDCQTILGNVDDNWSAFCDKVKETEKLICERAEEMKRSIEAQKRSLLEQLAVAKVEQQKQTTNVHEEIDRHQVVLENFIRYSKEVKEKGNACDVAKLAGKLNARAEELQKLNVDTDLAADYKVTEVSFTPGQTDDNQKQMFGKLAIDVYGMCESSCLLDILRMHFT